MIWLFYWIVFAFVSGFVGSNRKIGFWGSFLLSLFLSPLIGLIIAFSSDKKSEVESMAKQEVQIQALQEIRNNTQKSIVEQIKEAKELLDNGALTQSEFENIKQDIMRKTKSELKNDQSVDESSSCVFLENDIVIYKETGIKLRIGRINPDGTYKCFRIGSILSEGNFVSDELIYPHFKVGDYVMNKSSKVQMIVNKVNPDGTYQCFKDDGINYIGDFSDRDLILVEECLG
ncbi:SHOCT domain-containing protein [Phocaeicola dorei]|uniref:SHOCT domain-containing protein n=1 Tax=Phocaeicola dorei TaxID=357276 RepID=UPI001F2635D4|nr:SHOCT domain-containing protein [Phocaeicola dorei]MCE8443261.1 SHOCT domain-containing protein [Phocaeicola dorei]